MENINRSVADNKDSGAIPGAIDPAQLAQLLDAIEELLYHTEPMSAGAAPR